MCMRTSKFVPKWALMLGLVWMMSHTNGPLFYICILITHLLLDVYIVEWIPNNMYFVQKTFSFV